MPSQFTCEHRAGWSTCAWLIVRVSTANLHAACARLCQQRCVTLGSVGVDGCWCWLHCVTLFGAFHPKRLCVIRLGPHGSPWVPMGPHESPWFPMAPRKGPHGGWGPMSPGDLKVPPPPSRPASNADAPLVPATATLVAATTRQRQHHQQQKQQQQQHQHTHTHTHTHTNNSNSNNYIVFLDYTFGSGS